MSKYEKHLIFSAIIGIIGIPIFVLNYDDLSWATNRDIYWGMIALFALILGVLFFYLANKET